MESRTSKLNGIHRLTEWVHRSVLEGASKSRTWLRSELSQIRLSCICRRAEQGDAANEYRLGLIYERGEYGLRSDVKAYRWLLRAAFQGVAEAQAKVSEYHALGLGVPRNDEEAFNWCRKAAEQGHAPSQSRLAAMYRDGIGVSRNPLEAKKWSDRLARQNPPAPEFSTGQLSAC